ncbi:unnamed protein product [Ranitomeya imitator]|uniref:COMM domain-containing protein 1 n=1 Tax=Ranitomeya imitator TaxID=111125 RepID=A0ABN9LUN2_9NEOB|nr:unnamed protein product [Ranitomeya imitator]
MADAESSKALSGLLNGISQRRYYGNTEITDELLQTELYPELPPDEFRALHDKMQGIIKVQMAVEYLSHPRIKAKTMNGVLDREPGCTVKLSLDGSKESQNSSPDTEQGEVSAGHISTVYFIPLLLCARRKSIVSADMDINQIDAFLTAQTKKQGGITAEQSLVIAKFWKNHKKKIRESVIDQNRWENALKSLKWRIDVKSQSRHTEQVGSSAAIVELEIGAKDKIFPEVPNAII